MTADLNYYLGQTRIWPECDQMAKIKVRSRINGVVKVR